MEKLKIFMEELGFGRNEIAVYIVLLSMHESTVLQISRRTGIHRSNVYEALDSLMKKGLVSSLENPVKKYYYRDPKCLLEFIKDKESEFDVISEEIKNKTYSSSDTKIGRTKGKIALRNCLLSLLNHGPQVYVLGLNGICNESVDLIFNLFNRERLNQKVKMKLIYDNTKKDFNKKLKDIKRSGSVETKKASFLNNSNVTTFISYKKVIIVNWLDISIVEIEDKEIALDYIRYFDYLWVTFLQPKTIVV